MFFSNSANAWHWENIDTAHSDHFNFFLVHIDIRGAEMSGYIRQHTQVQLLCMSLIVFVVSLGLGVNWYLLSKLRRRASEKPCQSAAQNKNLSSVEWRNSHLHVHCLHRLRPNKLAADKDKWNYLDTSSSSRKWLADLHFRKGEGKRTVVRCSNRSLWRH